MSRALTKYRTAGRLVVEIHSDAAALGTAAAKATATCLRDVIAVKGEARVVFACAPSQDEFLASLVATSRSEIPVDWNRVTVFHMDDYVGLDGSHRQSFRSYLHQHLLRHVPIGTFHGIPAEESDSGAICAQYGKLLSEKPIDLICMGIGENGHIAFNDPPVADFDDPELIKIVQLDRDCRQQQVNDGCFLTFDEVPQHAYSLTVPVFRNAARLSVHVKGNRKASAINQMINAEISTACPASILRLHPNVTLYVDREAASQLETR